MSNEVKNAIDTGLQGLCVTEADWAVILRRTRSEARPAPRRPRQQWSFAVALAVVMIVLVAGAGLRLLGSTEDVTPLTQPDGQVTDAPEEFVPIGSEIDLTPEINIDANKAIALAEKYIHEEHDGAVDLRDAVIYEIGCEYVSQMREGNAFYANFYEVHFRALDAYATEYTVRVKADSGAVIGCEVQRGAGEWHTAQEILTGFSRVYGEDRRTWTQEQLRTYCKALKKAAEGSLRWMDYLYLQASYPDVAEDAMSREEVLAAVEADLVIIAHEYAKDAGWGIFPQEGEVRARYISAYPNPIWKIASEHTVSIDADGYTSLMTLLVEIDSVTGEVVHVDAVDAHYAEQYESFLHTTIEALKAVSTISGESPSFTEEQAMAVAAEYVRETWGETRDINDASLFEVTATLGKYAVHQGRHMLEYASIGEGEQTVYVLLVDWYGQVIAANRGTRTVTDNGLDGSIAGIAEKLESPFAVTAPALDWEYENLLTWQGYAAASNQRNDPIVQVFMNTVYLNDFYFTPTKIKNAAHAALGSHATTRTTAVLIDTEPNAVWKIAMETDQGNYLVEVDSVTCEVISTMRVKSLYESWYLPFVLTADLKAAGVPLTWDVQQTYLTAATDGHGTVDGMRIDHLYQRFKQLYGPNMGSWTQEQLRSFQEMAVLSSDYDYDLGVPCLRNTVYPDIPENAISKARAAQCAAEAMGLSMDGSALENWTLRGAVLIGTDSTPVWKVCISVPGSGSTQFWYAEVNCMTGRAQRVHQDAEGAASPGASYDYGTPQNLWFRDIVLEETIEECDATWESRGNG